MAADRALALVAGDHLHAGRPADHAHGRLHRLAREEGEQAGHALAADLLVIGAAEVHRRVQAAVAEARRLGPTPPAAGFHVAGASAVEGAAVLAHLPRIRATGRASGGE